MECSSAMVLPRVSSPALESTTRLDDRLAGAVVHPADVADATRRRRRTDEDGVGLGGPLPDEGHDGAVLVGVVRRPGVDGLEPRAVAAVTEAPLVAGAGGSGAPVDVLVGQEEAGRDLGGIEASPDVDALGGRVGAVGAAHPAAARQVQLGDRPAAFAGPAERVADQAAGAGHRRGRPDEVEAEAGEEAHGQGQGEGGEATKRLRTAAHGTPRCELRAQFMTAARCVRRRPGG